MTNFDRAFQRVIGFEAGYVNDPNDRGGETKFGISRRAYPNEDIRDMTLERAKELYKRDYWDAVRGDDLPYNVAYAMFDGAVNSGVRQSVRWMQRASMVKDDGILGPITIGSLLKNDPTVLVARYIGHRLDACTYFPSWASHSRGWTRRNASQLINIGK